MRARHLSLTVLALALALTSTAVAQRGDIVSARAMAALEALVNTNGDIGATTDSSGNLSVATGKVLLLPDGAVGAPSAAFTSDADGTGTGLYRVAANQLGLSANGILQGGASTSGIYIGASNDVLLTREAAAALQLGLDVNGAAVNQAVKAHDGITGSNISAANLTLGTQVGTGTGVGGVNSTWRPIVKASGTTAQTTAPGLTICPTKTLSNTTATAQTVAIIDLASNSAAGAEAHLTVTCTDGTNFDAETVSSVNSFVNKATVLTIGSAGGVTTATTAANNSGSCTIGQTWIAGTNQVLLKVTPVFTTIVPTTVTVYAEVITHQPSAVAVACQ